MAAAAVATPWALGTAVGGSGVRGYLHGTVQPWRAASLMRRRSAAQPAERCSPIAKRLCQTMRSRAVEAAPQQAQHTRLSGPRSTRVRRGVAREWQAERRSHLFKVLGTRAVQAKPRDRGCEWLGGRGRPLALTRDLDAVPHSSRAHGKLDVPRRPWRRIDGVVDLRTIAQQLSAEPRQGWHTQTCALRCAA